MKLTENGHIGKLNLYGLTELELKMDLKVITDYKLKTERKWSAKN